MISGWVIHQSTPKRDKADPQQLRSELVPTESGSFQTGSGSFQTESGSFQTESGSFQTESGSLQPSRGLSITSRDLTRPSRGSFQRDWGVMKPRRSWPKPNPGMFWALSKMAGPSLVWRLTSWNLAQTIWCPRSQAQTIIGSVSVVYSSVPEGPNVYSTRTQEELSLRRSEMFC